MSGGGRLDLRQLTSSAVHAASLRGRNNERGSGDTLLEDTEKPGMPKIDFAVDYRYVSIS